MKRQKILLRKEDIAMNEKHPDQAQIWAYLADREEDPGVSAHIHHCAECMKQVDLWREILRDRKRELNQEVESLPDTYWQKLETETISRLQPSPIILLRVFRYATVPVLAMLLLASLWIHRYSLGEGSITEEQLDMVAELSLSYGVLPAEDDLFQEASQLIHQPPYGSLSILDPDEDRAPEQEDPSFLSNWN